jgi:cytochrome c-type biogenesis protein CcmH
MRSLAAMLIVIGVVTGSAAAAEPQTTLPDVEDEVMCVQCGTPLNLSTAPVADRERAFIRREIARGKTKEEIKDGLVDIFGPTVLAVPEDKGFGIAAYWVPIVVGLLGLIAVLLAIRRWRRPAPTAAAGRPLQPEDERRLERELAAHDREG